MSFTLLTCRYPRPPENPIGSPRAFPGTVPACLRQARHALRGTNPPEEFTDHIMTRMDELRSWSLPTGQKCSSGLLTSHDAFQDANELYSRVFGYDAKGYGLNVNLLSSLVRNGGSAVGICNEESSLIGFAYGFTGFDGGTPYHYSQATVIDPRYQGLGCGRILKNCQRELTLHQGVRAMRWTFDPMLARNAHFNLNSLGARGIDFIENYYGRENTDRVLVEWKFGPDSERAKPVPVLPVGLQNEEFGVLIPDGEAFWIPVPTRLQADGDRSGSQARTRGRLASSLKCIFDAGFTLVSCLPAGPLTSAYLASRDPSEGT